MISPVLFSIGEITGVYIYLGNKGFMYPGSFSVWVTFVGENRDNFQITVYCSVILLRRQVDA